MHSLLNPTVSKQVTAHFMLSRQAQAKEGINCLFHHGQGRSQPHVPNSKSNLLSILLDGTLHTCTCMHMFWINHMPLCKQETSANLLFHLKPCNTVINCQPLDCRVIWPCCSKHLRLLRNHHLCWTDHPTSCFSQNGLDTNQASNVRSAASRQVQMKTQTSSRNTRSGHSP